MPFALNKPWQVEYFHDEKGRKVRCGAYYHSKTPSENILFLNGRTEFIEKYNYFPTELLGLLGEKYGFFTLDHPGQGQSYGRASHIESYQEYVDNVSAVCSRLNISEPIVVAHSMGGLISLKATMLGAIKPKRIILLSPFLGLPTIPFPEGLAISAIKALRLLKLGAMRWPVNEVDLPFEQNKLTNCLAHYERLRTWPEEPMGPTLSWVGASIEAIDFIHKVDNMRRLNCPVTIIAAQADEVVSVPETLAWFNKARIHAQNACELHLVNGAKHELLCEKEQTYRWVLDTIANGIKAEE